MKSSSEKPRRKPSGRKAAGAASPRSSAGKQVRDTPPVRTEVRIDSLDEQGYGVGRGEGGRRLRVSGVVPGDVVRIKVERVVRGEIFAQVLELLTPSLQRSMHPPCRESADCLGCPLIVMKYSGQKQWKTDLILNAMASYPELGTIVVEPLKSPMNLIHYRTTAKLTVAGKFSDPYIGIYRRASHDVFDLEECPLHHPLVNEVVRAVRQGITKLKVPIYNPQSRMGLLRYLVVRVSVHERKALVLFVAARRAFNELHHLGKYVQELIPAVQVVAQNINTSEGNVIFGPQDHFITRQNHLTEQIGEVKFQISPRSFFQINHGGAELIYGQVREWAGLTGKETVLDLYCGAGGIALFLAENAARVIGIEVVEEAVRDARINAKLNHRTNCLFEAGDAGELLEELAETEQSIDLVVLNPPRKGCEPQVLERVVRLLPGKIIYVSCSPQTLARDLALLQAFGYRCQKIQPVDMFPQTLHVESVALLEKAEKST